MNYLKVLFLTAFLGLFAVSCSYQPVTFDQQGISNLQNDLIQRFGKNAWYSEISIFQVSDKSINVRLKVTKDPNSLRGRGWLKEGADWTPIQYVSFQFNDGKPRYHLFQISYARTSLKKLSGFIDKSKRFLSQKGITNITVELASIQSAKIAESEPRRILYSVAFKNNQTGKSYSFVYDLDGKMVSYNH